MEDDSAMEGFFSSEADFEKVGCNRYDSRFERLRNGGNLGKAGRPGEVEIRDGFKDLCMSRKKLLVA